MATQTTPKKKTEEEAQQRIRIKVRSYDHRIIDESCKTIMEAITRSGATVAGPMPLPTEKQRVTVNRSTFKHKKARDQFEMRVHKRILDVVTVTPKTMDALASLNLPSGVDVEIKM